MTASSFIVFGIILYLYGCAQDYSAYDPYDDPCDEPLGYDDPYEGPYEDPCDDPFAN